MKCPVCLETICSKTLTTKNDYNIHHCIACDVIFSDPMKALSRVDYEKDYEKTFMHGLKMLRPPWFYPQDPFRSNIFFYDHWNWLQFLRNPPTSVKRLLDVGCQYGEFLAVATRIFCNWEVSGIDHNRNAVEWGRGHYGLELYGTTIEDFIKAYPERRFDAVTFFEILEHLEKPNEFIESVKKVLAPGGYMALSVPNSVEPPNHLTGWSEKSLRNFLTKHNFEILVLKNKPCYIFFNIGLLRLLILQLLSTKFGAVEVKTKLNSALDRLDRLKEAPSLKNRFCLCISASIGMKGYKGTYVLARLKD